MNLKTTVIATLPALAIAVATQASAEGNRYDYERYYAAEISVSDAYLAMEHSKDFDNQSAKDEPKPVLIDVRTLREYAAGHPEDAYNVPFPNIYKTGDQDPAALYWEVYDIVKGRMDTPIMLLCRTGARSVRAGNILANPDSDAKTAGLPPFTNVTNIWEGFVGQHRYAFDGGTILLDEGKPVPLDLNNDDALNGDAADVFVEVKDANPDKDGWRNFAALPWTTQIQKPLSYQRNPGLYRALNLTPVE